MCCQVYDTDFSSCDRPVDTVFELVNVGVERLFRCHHMGHYVCASADFAEILTKHERSVVLTDSLSMNSTEGRE